jgi:hypothetical protein
MRRVCEDDKAMELSLMTSSHCSLWTHISHTNIHFLQVAKIFARRRQDPRRGRRRHHKPPILWSWISILSCLALWRSNLLLKPTSTKLTPILQTMKFDSWERRPNVSSHYIVFVRAATLCHCAEFLWLGTLFPKMLVLNIAI